MNEKTSEILEAARTLFFRYGFAKTTMGDIATQANVARQTVYNTFPGKPEILIAVVRQVGIETIRDIELAWQTCETLEDKMSSYQTLTAVRWFEAMEQSPDWVGVMEGVYETACNALAEHVKQTRDLLMPCFAQAYETASDPTLSLEDLVEFFQFSSANAKHGATDMQQLQRRLSSIRAATLHMLK